jgi:hypothetical protein
MSPFLFAVVIFEISIFAQGSLDHDIPLLSFPLSQDDSCKPPYLAFFLKVLSHKLSCLGCPAARILLISAFPNFSLCRITRVIHQHLASSLFLRQVSIPFAQVGLKPQSSYFHCLGSCPTGLCFFVVVVLLKVVVSALHG